MATTYRLVNTIDADRLPQLMELYPGEWWTGAVLRAWASRDRIRALCWCAASRDHVEAV